MRLVSKLLALAGTGALGTNAFETSIFTFPTSNHGLQNTGFEPQTVSEDVARLVLELRSKSSLATTLGRADTDIIERLNQFAGTGSTLFGGSNSNSHDAQDKSIVFLEGLEPEVASHMRSSQPNSLFVPRASWDLVQGSLDSVRGSDTWGKRCIYLEGHSETGSETAQSAQECLYRDPVLAHEHRLFGQALLGLIDSVDTWANKDQRTTASMVSFKKTPHPSKVVIQFIESLFQDLIHESSKGNREITVVLLPSTRGPLYATEILRQDSKAGSKSSMRSLSARDGLPKAVQGIHSNLAPVCHSSNASCAEATNNCSGHGYCYLKHGSGDEGATGNCYACRCQETVVRKSDGTTQKIQWGGPACQKKDLSSPFFLIVGVSILAIVSVGSAVGMLFGMGQQELPSVIAAGVGASKAQT